MPKLKCSVKGCSSQGSTLFRFPKEQKQLDLWKKLLGMVKVESSMRVCSNHFSPLMRGDNNTGRHLRLYHCAVPDLNLGPLAPASMPKDVSSSTQQVASITPNNSSAAAQFFDPLFIAASPATLKEFTEGSERLSNLPMIKGQTLITIVPAKKSTEFSTPPVAKPCATIKDCSTCFVKDIAIKHANEKIHKLEKENSKLMRKVDVLLQYLEAKNCTIDMQREELKDLKAGMQKKDATNNN